MNTLAVGHEVVSVEQWTEARKALLAKEKELTRQRDEVSRQRRELPWVKVEKDYQFEGPDGQEGLSDLFCGRSQLMVYHFMFSPEWEEGCRGCSYLADHIDGSRIHLEHRDTTLVVVSRAPYEKLKAFQKRMGWHFKWVSSSDTDFNFDYHVSFTKDQITDGKVYYNYAASGSKMSDLPGASVFCKEASGDVFHTYSAFARGLDALLGTYTLLDMTPKGRDEEGLPSPMAWLRLHDSYEDALGGRSHAQERRE